MKTESKLTAAAASIRIKSILWWILLVSSALMTAGGIGTLISPKEGTVSDLGTSLFLIALFVGLCVLSVFKILNLKKQKAAIKNYREYVARLSNDREKSLLRLAQGMNLPLETIESHVAILIKKGLIKNAYIDKAAHALMLPQYDLYAQIPNAVPVAVTCSCCGGNTVIPENTVGTCQFCGSPVSAIRK